MIGKKYISKYLFMQINVLLQSELYRPLGLLKFHVTASLSV